MMYFRCQCGKSTAFGSMMPQRCVGCPNCNTTLTSHPDCHKEPEPHQYVTRYDEVTGKPYEICINCSTIKPVKG